MGGEWTGSASTLQHSDNATGISIDSNRKVKLLTLEEGREGGWNGKRVANVDVFVSPCAAVDDNIGPKQQEAFTREGKHGSSSFLKRMLLG